MIRSQDQKIIFSQLIHQSSKSSVELLNFTSVSFRISSMPPQSVKIHQIHKAETMKETGAIENQDTFAVIGASVAENFGVQMPQDTIGKSILRELQ